MLHITASRQAAPSPSWLCAALAAGARHLRLEHHELEAAGAAAPGLQVCQQAAGGGAHGGVGGKGHPAAAAVSGYLACCCYLPFYLHCITCDCWNLLLLLLYSCAVGSHISAPHPTPPGQGQHPIVYWTPVGKNTVRMVCTAPVDLPKGEWVGVGSGPSCSNGNQSAAVLRVWGGEPMRQHRPSHQPCTASCLWSPSCTRQQAPRWSASWCRA